MGFGRLIRVRAHRRDAQATIYVVAEAEVEKAIDILKIALAQPSYEYDDLGRVRARYRYPVKCIGSATRPVHPHMTSACVP
jgi:hypothetical protein